MNAPFLPPCHTVTRDQLAQRLAGLMRVYGDEARMSPEFAAQPRTPGYCVMCGNKLPTVWRAVKWTPPEDDSVVGSFSMVEFGHDSESQRKLALVREKYAPVVVAKGRDNTNLVTYNGYFLWPVTACEAITPEVSAEASRIACARFRDVQAAASSSSQPQPARQDRASSAARALARNGI